ncbi:hypothetical protein BT93_F3407 [Corymbia citriodora subsp. variegata]|nr:hypothetical protein BT93_F3407 [Corymbia citriodora subsp. variegata]
MVTLLITGVLFLCPIQSSTPTELIAELNSPFCLRGRFLIWSPRLWVFELVRKSGFFFFFFFFPNLAEEEKSVHLKARELGSFFFPRLRCRV